MGNDALYLVTSKRPPIFNMALDEWLFDQVRRQKMPQAVLRLYTWEPPGITIGFNQAYERAIDQTKITSPVTVVRRITGGRAIYHESSEVTFSFSTSLPSFGSVPPSLTEANSLMSEMLKDIFSQIGINSRWQKRPQVSRSNSALKSPACFQSVAKYELTAGGAKIAGVAQRKISNFIIHQGSLKLNGMSHFPAIGQEAMKPVAKADGSAGYSLDELKDCFLAVFAKNLHLKFRRFSPSPQHLTEIGEKIALLTKNPLEKRRFD